MAYSVDIYLPSMLSDMHKDAYGFRPHGKYRNFSDIQMYCEMDRLSAMVSEQIDAEEKQLQEDIKLFEQRIADVMEISCVDRQTVLEWWIEAEEDEEGYFNPEHYIWNLGFSRYTEYGHGLLNEFMDILEHRGDLVPA